MTKVSYKYVSSPDDIDIEPDDYFIECKFDKYEAGIQYGKTLGEYESEDDALVDIIKDVKESGYYPNIWSVSDHGNMVQIELLEPIEGF